MRRHWRSLARLAFCFGALLAAGIEVRGQLSQLDLSIKQPGTITSATEQYLLNSINAERTLAGLPTVKLDRTLQAAAHGHALEMARASTLSHRLQGEPDLSARGSAVGARFSRITENVAVGPSIATMHGALMQSPHHRDNILDSQVDTVGLAVVEANGSLWAVEDFTRSVDQISLDAQEQKVADLLKGMQIEAGPTAAARATCRLQSGFVGSRPAMTMRYTTGDLSKMPEELRNRLQGFAPRAVAVGACTPTESPSVFSSYNIAVMVYR